MKKRVIVSLTSYPKRIDIALESVKRLEKQTVKPDKVVLFLSKEEFSDESMLETSDINNLNFEIHWVDQNLRPHNKYYYAFQEYRNDYVITIDDDNIYSDDMVECFLKNAEKFPNAVLSMRAHLITRDVSGNIAPYNDWLQKCYEFVNVPRMDLIATGNGACLYSPELFDQELFNTNVIIENCLYTDDLWLKVMELLSNIPVVLITDKPKHREIQVEGLYSTRNQNGGNDLSWNKMWGIYKDFKGNIGILAKRIRLEDLLTTEEAKNVTLYQSKNEFLSFWNEKIGERKVRLYGAGRWAQRIIRVLEDLNKDAAVRSFLVEQIEDNFREVYGKKVDSISNFCGDDLIVVALCESSIYEIFWRLVYLYHIDPEQIVLLDARTYELLYTIDHMLENGCYKVSVIIPVYNVEQYLVECIESVRNQLLRDIEIICIDDCSKDNSLNLLHKYDGVDNRIKIFGNRENRGLSVTRNIGMELSRGKYICFVDSDDSLRPDALQILYSTAEEKNTDILVYGAKSFDDKNPDSQEDYFFNRITTDKVMSGKDIFTQMMRTGDMRVMAQIQFWKRKSLNEQRLRFYKGILHEDTLFSYMGYVRAKRVMCVPYSFYQYRLRSDSITGKKPGKHAIQSMLTIYQEVLKYWIAHPKDNLDEVSVRFLRGRKNILNEKAAEMSDSLEEVIYETGEFSLTSFVADLLLEGCYKAENYFGKENMEILKSGRRNYIYGAGIIGKQTIKNMREAGINIDGVLVSESEGNPENIQGIPVICMKDVDVEKIKSGNIVLGVGKRNLADVIGVLMKYEIFDYIVLPKYKEV